MSKRIKTSTLSRNIYWEEKRKSFWAEIARKWKITQRIIANHNTPKKFFNFLTVESDKNLKPSKVHSLPYNLCIDPTNICNLRCPLCATGQGIFKKKGILDFEVYQKVIDELGDYLYKVGLFNWGEPFLNKEIYRMIKYAADRNIGTCISSNFSIPFDEQKAEELINAGIEHLIISMDGVKQETYEIYRVGGNLSKVIKNVETLTKKKNELNGRLPFIEIQFLVMKHNENELKEIEKLVLRLGVDSLTFVPIFVNAKNKQQADKWLPKAPKYSRYDYQTGEDKFLRSIKTCDWLYRTAVINWDGTVLPCCHYIGPNITFGDVRKEKFRSIWNNDLFQSSRAVFNTDKKIKLQTPCLKCKGYPKPVEESGT